MKTAQDQIWDKIRDLKYVTNSEALKKAKDINYFSPRLGLEVRGVKPQTTLRVLRKLAEDERLLKVKGAEYVRLKCQDRFKKEIVIYKPVDQRLF